jgi:hypothetical protein
MVASKEDVPGYIEGILGSISYQAVRREKSCQIRARDSFPRLEALFVNSGLRQEREHKRYLRVEMTQKTISGPYSAFKSSGSCLVSGIPIAANLQDSAA